LDRPGLEDAGDLPERLEGDVLITSPRDRLDVEARLPGPYLHRRTLFRQGLQLDVWIDARHAAVVPSDWEPVGPEEPQ